MADRRDGWEAGDAEDPSGNGPAPDDPVAACVEAVYTALGDGDGDALLALLADGFIGVLSAGLPPPIGGRHVGARAMIDDGWWEIGRRYRVRAVPLDWYPMADGRLLVMGSYRGCHRITGAGVDADFAHLWTVVDGHVAALHQVTDTASWGLGPTA